MNQLQMFNFENHQVRILEKDGEPYFVGKDIAQLLGYSNPRDALSKHVESEDKGVAKCDTLGGAQNLTVINESGMYSLVLSSKLESAKRFKRWVTNDVLPSIRKHGAYLTPETLEQTMQDPDFLIGILNGLKEEQEKRKQAEFQVWQANQIIEQDKPYTNFGKVVSMSDGAINIGILAKMLYDKHGINIGRNKLIAWMRDKGFLIKQKGAEKNLPQQKYIEHGWFKVRPTIVKRTHGDIQTGTTLITGKGQVEIANILISELSKEQQIQEG